jgi:amino acid/peptide transporter (Peptide:H+ symporter), bacterial
MAYQTLEEIQDFKGKYPKQLYLLFFTEMWERFTFYGMRALLILFMTSQLFFPDEKANLTYGAYQALVYAMPVFGGMIADRLMGFRRAIVWGGILMLIGNFTLAIPNNIWTFYLGMGCIVVGNGFFKPNISSIVGNLYKPGDPRRDGGFSLFYMGINVGAFLGSLLCGWIGQTYSWHMGFGLAGVFMILGLSVFLANQKKLGPIGLPPSNTKTRKDQIVMGDPADLPQDSQTEMLITVGNDADRKSKERLVFIGSILAIPVFAILLYYYKVMGAVFVPFGLLALGYILYLAGKEPLEARLKIFAALVLTIFSVLFWGFYEQGGGSLNLFADRNVNMNFFGIELSSAAVNNSVNPLWVIFLSPVFGYIWIALANKRLEPNSSIKFALGLILLGLSFYIFVIAGHSAVNGKISLGMFVIGYFVMSCGELCLSPIGLSMITKLSPSKMVGLMMGMWFLASAFGQYVAGLVGTMMAVPQEGEGSAIIDPVASLPIYTSVFETIAYISVGSGLFLLVLSPLLKRWMKDVN